MPEQKSSKKRLFYYCCCYCRCAYFRCLVARRRYAGTADSVGKQIEQAGRNQQVITGGIADAEITLAASQQALTEAKEAIGTATSSAGRLESYLAESGSLIAECREILESVGKDAGEESTERIRGTDR